MDGVPVVIDVIDNGGHLTHREWRMLRYLGRYADTSNSVPVSEIRELDGLILSGGAARVGRLAARKLCRIPSEVPICGICAGHHLMHRHYGEAEPSRNSEQQPFP